MRSGRRGGEQALAFDEVDDIGQPLPGLLVREHEGARAAHPARVAVHDLERGAHQRREVDLVDHQQVAARDARPALARDLVAGRDVDDIDRQVRKLGRESRRQVVAAGLDEDDVQPGKARIESDRKSVV